MNNKGVEQLLDETMTEIIGIKSIIDADQFSPIVPYLNKYSIMKISGTLETAYKTIITDTAKKGCTTIQPKNFISSLVLESSKNPSYDHICGSLKQFDKAWNKDFKIQISARSDSANILSSLKDINEARNTFAHGGNPMNSITSLLADYTNARVIIEILDSICV